MSWHTLKWHTAHYITLLAAGEAECRHPRLCGQFSYTELSCPCWSHLPSLSLSRQACSMVCPQCCYGPYRIMMLGQLHVLHTTLRKHQFPSPSGNMNSKIGELWSFCWLQMYKTTLLYVGETGWPVRPPVTHTHNIIRNYIKTGFKHIVHMVCSWQAAVVVILFFLT